MEVVTFDKFIFLYLYTLFFWTYFRIAYSLLATRCSPGRSSSRLWIFEKKSHFSFHSIYCCTCYYITLHYITLHYRHFKRHLHLKWPVVHQQLHVIRNTAHRPSTQASYTASRVRPKRKISCAAAQIAATLTISFPRWRHIISVISLWYHNPYTYGAIYPFCPNVILNRIRPQPRELEIANDASNLML